MRARSPPRRVSAPAECCSWSDPRAVTGSRVVKYDPGMRNLGTIFAASLLLAIGACDCGGDDGGGGGGGGTDAGFTRDAGRIDSGPTGSTAACSNGLDDDGDGAIDGFDPECTGATDDDESTYATGIPGDNRDPMWQDCFFDGNSGAGDDSCRYRTECLTGDLPATDPDCQVSDSCIRFCAARTPNGCDCFGCCEITLADGTTQNILLDADCNFEEPSGCSTCVPTTECDNECGECELCPGRTVEDLPPTCTPDGGMAMYECEGGVTCGEGFPPCPDMQYCQLGCCMNSPI